MALYFCEPVGVLRFSMCALLRKLSFRFQFDGHMPDRIRVREIKNEMN